HNVPAGLIYGVDGWLYGTTAKKGNVNQGAIFKLATDGSGFALVHEFPESFYVPVLHIVEGEPGQLCGSAFLYADARRRWQAERVLFQLGTDGTAFETLRTSPVSFDFESYPEESSGIVARAGFIYGFTAGSLFRMNVHTREFTK